MHTEVVVKKLLFPKNATLFLEMTNHRNVVHHLVTESLPEFEELHMCDNGLELDVASMIVKCATNIIWNNYCKGRNESAAAANADAKECQLRTVPKK